MWAWAPGEANARARKQTWGADYTLEEKQKGVENCATGLRRDLIEPPDHDPADEGRDDDDEEEEEYEATDEEDEDDSAMDIETKQPTTENKESPGIRLDLPTTDLMPLNMLHKFMTTGR